MNPGVVVLVAAGVLLLLVVASCISRANRLDRLHVRADAARAALHAALERRAVVARAIAVSTGDEHLHATATAAERAPATLREDTENDLGRLLVRLEREALPVGLADELAEAEHRVMLGRRVHNDAVRDILALRSRRFVRWLRLAGKAPAPTYFEITDVLGEDDTPAQVAPRPGRVGRVVLLDTAGRVLLIESVEPSRPAEPFWIVPGGGLLDGEEVRTAASRELAGATGFLLPAERLEGPVWRRHAVFRIGGRTVVADEEFFVAAGQADVEPGAGRDVRGDVVAGVSQLADPGRATLPRHRWWTAHELRTTTDVVHPRRLGDLLGSVRPGDWDGVTRSIS